MIVLKIEREGTFKVLIQDLEGCPGHMAMWVRLGRGTIEVAVERGERVRYECRGWGMNERCVVKVSH